MIGCAGKGRVRHRDKSLTSIQDSLTRFVTCYSFMILFWWNRIRFAYSYMIHHSPLDKYCGKENRNDTQDTISLSQFLAFKNTSS